MTRSFVILPAIIAFTLLNFLFFFTVTSVNSDTLFVNQQYVDQTNDWELVHSPTGSFRILSPDGNLTRFPSENNIEKCKIMGYPDIQGVSYNSDGKTLYATLWVNPFMINQSTSYTQVKNSWISGVYQMYIDFPSVYDNGTDYIYSIKWNPLNQKWSPILEERNIGEGKNKVLGLISDREGFIDNDKKYVTFSLNRSMLNLPDRYKIIFSVWGIFQNNEGRVCDLIDTTGFIDIPPPQFNLSISDVPSYIRKGQTINVPVHIASNSGINSQARLEAINNTDSIHLNINPKKVNIPPYSVADSLLEIKALDSNYPAQVTLKATISFASSPGLQSGAILSIPSVINNITKEVRFSIGIQPELGIFDYVNNTLNTWGTAATQALALIAGLGTAATTITLIITKLRRQEEQKDKDENRLN